MGMVRASSGSVRIEGCDLAGRPADVVSRAGVAIVPQGRRVFAPLTVEENLRIARRGKGGGKGDWTVDQIYDLMPRLRERRRNLGWQLSGGEQQMLSIGRALLCSPRLLLLDEPSDGLAPAVVAQVGTVLRALRETGLTLLVVEQDLRLAFDVAERVLVMTKGRIMHEDDVASFRADGVQARAMLGIG